MYYDTLQSVKIKSAKNFFINFLNELGNFKQNIMNGGLKGTDLSKNTTEK